MSGAFFPKYLKIYDDPTNEIWTIVLFDLLIYSTVWIMIYVPKILFKKKKEDIGLPMDTSTAQQ